MSCIKYLMKNASIAFVSVALLLGSAPIVATPATAGQAAITSCSELHTVELQGKPSGLKIEPSGLVYSPDIKRFIGVTDTYNELVEDYRLDSTKDNRKWVVFSLPDFTQYVGRCSPAVLLAAPMFDIVNESDFTDPMPFDLEGISRIGKYYYVIGSQSRHAKSASRDSVHRYQFFQFTINENTKKIDDFKRFYGFIPKHVKVRVDDAEDPPEGKFSFNFRDWILANESSLNWPVSARIGMAEVGGGLNIEGLTSRAFTSTVDQSKRLQFILGVRGPLLKQDKCNTKVPCENFSSVEGYAYTLVFDAFNVDEKPSLYDVEVFGKIYSGNGIRGLEYVDFNSLSGGKIKGQGYLVVLGRSDDEKERLIAGFVDLSRHKDQFVPGELRCSRTLKGAFVGEGISAREVVFDRNPDGSTLVSISAAIVDDLKHNATTYNCKFTTPSDQGSITLSCPPGPEVLAGNRRHSFDYDSDPTDYDEINWNMAIVNINEGMSCQYIARKGGLSSYYVASNDKLSCLQSDFAGWEESEAETGVDIDCKSDRKKCTAICREN